MTFKKASLALLMGFIVLLFIGTGLATIVGFNFGGYVVPFMHILGALVLFLEIGVKRFSNLSNLSKNGAQQWITMAIALVSIVNGVLIFPGIDIMVPFLQNVSSFVLIL